MEEKNEANADARPIFISHSHKDRRLVEVFIKDVLIEGLGISKDLCFCSSFDFTGIKPGVSKNKALAEYLCEAKVCIALITSNFLRSPDCNAELGYIWASNKANSDAVLPFQYRTPKTNQTPWYLDEISKLNMEKETDLNQLDVAFSKAENVSYSLSTEWGRIRDTFIRNLPNLVPDVPLSIDYRSMGHFIQACDNYDRVLYFNVQVSFDDWFRPELQTHLALQDATTTLWQMGKIIDVSSKEYATKALLHDDIPDYYGTPTARILFVAETRDELRDKLRKNEPDVASFVDLSLIHFLMATPLAIVTVDQLAHIMLSEPDSSRSHDDDFDFIAQGEKCESLFNLPNLKSAKLDQKNLEEELKIRLGDMFLRPSDDERSPSIDFALLMNNRLRDGTQKNEVWTGGLSEATFEACYEQIEDMDTAQVFYALGKKIEHAVFKPLKAKISNLQKDQVKDAHSTKKLPKELKNEPGDTTLASLFKEKTENRRRRDAKKITRKLIASRHPAFRAFHDVENDPKLRPLFAKAMKFVEPQYCPLVLLGEANGDATKKIFEIAAD